MHGLETVPGNETAPTDLMPVDGRKVQVQASPADEIAQIGRCGGDGHHGPRVVDKGRDEHERPVEAAKYRAEKQDQARMRSEHGIECHGQAYGEAPGDTFRAQVRMQNVELELCVETPWGRWGDGCIRRYRWVGQWIINHERPGRFEW